MPKQVSTRAGQIKISVFDVDDECGVFLDGQQMTKVYGGQTESVHFDLGGGQTADLRFEVYNNWGGPFKSTINITGPGGQIERFRPRGDTMPGVNVAWSAELSLVGA